MKSKSKQYQKPEKTQLEIGHYHTKWTRHLERTPEETSNKPDQTIQGEQIQLKDFVRMHATGEIPEMAMSAFDFTPDQEDNHDLDVSPRYATDMVERTEAIQNNIQQQLDLEQQILEAAAEEAAHKKKSKKQEKAQAPNDNQNDDTEPEPEPEKLD